MPGGTRMEDSVAKARTRSAARTGDAALDPCERHWAFDAVSVSARRATLARAAQRAALAAPASGDSEAVESIATLSMAYDLAVGERFDAESGGSDWPSRAPHTAQELVLSADRALTLLSALPLPKDPDALDLRRLHLAAIAAVAGKPESFVAWRARLDVARASPAPTLTTVWETLLTEQRLSGPEALREQIAQLREEVTAAPARAASLDLSMRAFAQANLVTAAGDLLTYRTSGAPTNLLARLAVLMQDARRGTPGDRQMRAVLVWLAYGVTALVAPLDDQLVLPSV